MIIHAGKTYILKHWHNDNTYFKVRPTTVNAQVQWSAISEEDQRFTDEKSGYSFRNKAGTQYGGVEPWRLIPLEVWYSPLYNALRENENEP
jgi:hypothetical protein